VKDGAVLQETRARNSSVADFVELTKPRITLLVVLTAAVGYFMASRDGLSLPGLFHILFGTALVAAAAGVLNQVIERDADAKMIRTADRAIPAGRVTPETALLFGTILALGGVVYITFFLNVAAGLLAIGTLVSYVFIYTPLKRVTTLNTLVGAVPGALPPVGGWAAATGGISREAGVLFLIVFLWQLPHFLAIAWLLREDFARAGFRMLTVKAWRISAPLHQPASLTATERNSG
jgi:protoheme IX farnesyltransferase